MSSAETDPNRLIPWLASRYVLSDIAACQLLRSYTNDVYLVTMAEQRFVLKIYGETWRTPSEIAFELDLLRHLSGKGLTIPLPIAGKTGFIQRVPENHRSRNAVLFEYATGSKPQPPFTPELYFAFGRAIGLMHEFSSDFTTPHSRPILDLEYLLDRPFAQIMLLLASSADRTFLADLAGKLKRRIAEYALHGLEWGAIHGDATMDNLHVTAGGDIILYDFDSGGFGWRAADLQGWAVNKKSFPFQWEAFSAGYASIRTLAPINLIAAPDFTLIWDIWGMQIDLDARILRQGEARAQDYLSEQMAVIRTRLAP